MIDQNKKNGWQLAILAGLVIVITLLISIYSYAPPQAQPATIADSEFSAQRAMQHLKVITSQPHPTGSIANQQVRDYIMKELTTLGFEVQLQRSIQLDIDQLSQPLKGATIENIIARKAGTKNNRALLLMAHYDSVAVAPGAGDDGCGVAALLETARALKHNQPLNNDLILLFSDGEEIGLFGAQAFVNEHPWVADIGLTLNFEGRGNTGPAIMFETSRQNGRLIAEFASVAPHPFASSLTYEAYQRMPNDTDLTILKNKGLAGLNFAYVNGLARYHTSRDSWENFNPNSLQHIGSYALSLSKHFGNLPLTDLAAPDLIYFDLLGKYLVRYSHLTGQLLTGFTLIILLLLLIVGYRQKQLTISGLLLGAATFLIGMLGAGSLAFGLTSLIKEYDIGGRWVLYGYTNNSGIYMSGIAALAVLFMLLLFIVARTRKKSIDLFAGGLIWWAVLMVFTMIYLPGVSYIFTWPLLSALIALALSLRANANDFIKQLSILICAIPALLLIGQLSYLLYISLTLSMAAAVVIVIVLLIGAVLPALEMIIVKQRWLLPLISGSAGVILLIYAILSGSYNSNYPRPNQICYWLKADTAEAQWLSMDRSVDPWTSQFFAANTPRESLPEFETQFGYRFLHQTAPAISLLPPKVELISEELIEGNRVVKLRFTSLRQAEILKIEASAPLKTVSINDKQFNYIKADGWGLYFRGIPTAGLEITFKLAGNEPIKLKVADQSYGLLAIPELKIKPRPADYMPMPHNPLDNSLFVSKNYQF